MLIPSLPQDLAFYKSENILPQMPVKWEQGKSCSEVVQGRKGEVEDCSTLAVVRESCKAHHKKGKHSGNENVQDEKWTQWKNLVETNWLNWVRSPVKLASEITFLWPEDSSSAFKWWGKPPQFYIDSFSFCSVMTKFSTCGIMNKSDKSKTELVEWKH